MARLCERLLAAGAEVAITREGDDRTRVLVRGAGGPLVPAPEEEQRQPVAPPGPAAALRPDKPVATTTAPKETSPAAETQAPADETPTAPLEPEGVRSPYQRVVGELRELDIYGGKVRALEVARRRKALDLIRFRMPMAVEAYSVDHFDQNGGLLRLYDRLDAESPRDACGVLYVETSGPAGIRAIHIAVGNEDVRLSPDAAAESTEPNPADAEAVQSAKNQRLILGFALVVTLLVAYTVFGT